MTSEPIENVVGPCIKCGAEHEPELTPCDPAGLRETLVEEIEDEEASTIRCPHCLDVLGYRWQPSTTSHP